MAEKFINKINETERERIAGEYNCSDVNDITKLINEHFSNEELNTVNNDIDTILLNNLSSNRANQESTDLNMKVDPWNVLDDLDKLDHALQHLQQSNPNININNMAQQEVDALTIATNSCTAMNVPSHKRKKNFMFIQPKKQKIKPSSTSLTFAQPSTSANPSTSQQPSNLLSSAQSSQLERSTTSQTSPQSSTNQSPPVSHKKPRSPQVGRGYRTSLGENAVTQHFTPSNNYDILLALKELEPKIVQHLHNKIGSGIKWYILMHTIYSRVIKNDKDELVETTQPVYQSSKTYTTLDSSEITDVIPELFQFIYTKFQEFEREGSGWSLDPIVSVEVHTAVYDPLAGRSYIPTPKKLKDKKAIVNVQNNDNKCFLWSVLAHIHSVNTHPYRINHYLKYEHELNVKGIKFPVTRDQIKTFEANNNISINLFGYENEKVVPLYLSKFDFERKINLLLISIGEKRHYCLIKNFSRLMGDRTKHKHKQFYCFNCLHGFSKEDLLKQHKENCMVHKPQRTTFPKNDDEKFIHFRSIAKQLQVPFIIYADFECFTSEVNDGGNKYQHHIPNSFCYTVICQDMTHSKRPILYRGDNVIDVFYNKILEEERRIYEVLSNVKDIIITDTQKREFEQATACHICGGELGADRVQDHCHLTGRYRGPAHNTCNLEYKFVKFGNKAESRYVIPIVFHNLRGYDSHLLMEGLGKHKKRRLTVIPNTIEKYISFSLANIKFIDSFQFMGASLQKLVNNLASEGLQMFKITTKYIKENQDLLIRKGVYPYDYVNKSSKLLECSLPSKEQFFL